MAKLQAGEIDHLVEFELSEDSLERIAAVFPFVARPDVAEELRQLAFAYHEQLAMVRPELQAVAKVYAKVSKLSSSIHSLVKYLSELEASDPIAEPAGVYVFDDLRYTFPAWHARHWSDILRRSDHARLLLRDHALSERARLLNAYRHRQGGLRVHRLGFVADRLHTLLLGEGIRPTAYFDPITGEIRGALVCLVNAFVSELEVPPELLPTDLGQLTRAVNRVVKLGR